MSNQTQSDNPVEVPSDVYNQLEATRESGAVNMFTEVKRGLKEFGFDEALTWVNDNPDAYVEGFMSRGFAPHGDDTDE